MISLIIQPFFLQALLAGTVIAIVCAVVGYFVVLRSQAFAAHALSHVGFAGATGAALFGLTSLVGTFLFTFLSAIGIGKLSEKPEQRDVEIGMILSFALGCGVLFLKLYTANASEAVGILFGSILSVTPFDVMLSVVTGILTIGLILFLFRPLYFASIDPETARARAVPVGILSLLFMLILALAVAQAILVVGVLLVFALLIAPPAIAQHICPQPLRALFLSILLGLLFTWGGMILAVLVHGPVGFFIAASASLTYLCIVPLKDYRLPHPKSFFSHVSH